MLTDRESNQDSRFLAIEDTYPYVVEKIGNGCEAGPDGGEYTCGEYELVVYTDKSDPAIKVDALVTSTPLEKCNPSKVDTLVSSVAEETNLKSSDPSISEHGTRFYKLELS